MDGAPSPLFSFFWAGDTQVVCADACMSVVQCAFRCAPCAAFWQSQRNRFSSMLGLGDDVEHPISFPGTNWTTKPRRQDRHGGQHKWFSWWPGRLVKWVMLAARRHWNCPYLGCWEQPKGRALPNLPVWFFVFVDFGTRFLSIFDFDFEAATRPCWCLGCSRDVHLTKAVRCLLASSRKALCHRSGDGGIILSQDLVAWVAGCKSVGLIWNLVCFFWQQVSNLMTFW